MTDIIDFIKFVFYTIMPFYLVYLYCRVHFPAFNMHMHKFIVETFGDGDIERGSEK